MTKLDPRQPIEEQMNTVDRPRYIPFHLINLANTLSRSASRLYLTLFDVGVIEWRILSILAIESNVTAVHICQSIDLDRGAASRSLQTLEGMKLVATKRDKKDSRKRLVEITDKGREIHNNILRIAVERQKLLVAGLSIQEVDQLLSLLSRLTGNLPEIQAHDARLIAEHTVRLKKGLLSD